MMSYLGCTAEQLQEEYRQLLHEYETCKAKGLKSKKIKYSMADIGGVGVVGNSISHTLSI